MSRVRILVGDYLQRGLVLIFILLFVYAAVSKLLDFETFQVQLAQSPLLSAYAEILAWIVPVTELLIAGMLSFESTKKLGLSGFFFMMVMFSGYIFFILKFADFVPCSCGGVLEKMSWGQHLVFNLVFVALSGIILYFGIGGKRRQRWMALGSQFILGISVVAVLFAFSERKMQRNNALQRRYLPHPIEKVASYDLKYDTYYIAGVTDSVVYLGNYGAPLLLKEIHFHEQKEKVNQLYLSDMTLPYRRVKTTVKHPFFFISDGTVPVVFRGAINSKYGVTFSYQEAYFSEMVISDTSSFAFITSTGEERTRSLGMIIKSSGKDSLILKKDILKNTNENNFASDGMLLWNDEYKKYLYLYYYRNQVEVIDIFMEKYQTITTIDTIRDPLLKTVYSNSTQEWILTGGTTTVNRLGSAAGQLLYISSDRLGKNEDAKNLKYASIIDVYNFMEGSYRFSFYLYHKTGAILTDLVVRNGFLYALSDNELLIYKLKPIFFRDVDFNAKYTAQYQEKDRTPEK